MATYGTTGTTTDALRRGQIQDEHIRETGELISSDKVKGTTVYNAAGDNLGSIHDLMIDKRAGRVAYAVMSFGGFLGIGEKFHPLPWNVLTYDESKGGYNIDLTTDQLRSAPSYSREELARFGRGRKGRHLLWRPGLSAADLSGFQRQPLPSGIRRGRLFRLRHPPNIPAGGAQISCAINSYARG